MLGNLSETEAVVTINRQTIKVAPGGGQKGDGPMLDLKPGTYKASVKVWESRRSTRTSRWSRARRSAC